MPSKGRPIHTINRELRETPDASEPSFSYEDRFFYGDGGQDDEDDDVVVSAVMNVEDMEDEFHRRLANNSNNRRKSSGGTNGSNSSNNNHFSASGSSNGGGSGSFWRTSEASAVLPIIMMGGNNNASISSNDGNLNDNSFNNDGNSRSIGIRSGSIGNSFDGSASGKGATSRNRSSSTGNNGTFFSKVASGGGSNRITTETTFPTPVVVRERKSSGGLLGAALQLHEGNNSKISSASGASAGVGASGNTAPISSPSTGADYHYQLQLQSKASRFQRQGSSTVSVNSTGNSSINNNNNNNIQQKKKDVTKARTEARKWKLEAQHSGTIEYGHEEPDDGLENRADEDDAATDSTSSNTPGEHQQQYHSGFNASNDALTAVSSDDEASSAAGSSIVRSYKRSSTGNISSSGSVTGGGSTAGGTGHCRTESGASLFGKSSSLIFPTGVNSTGATVSDPAVLSTPEAAVAAAAAVTSQLTNSSGDAVSINGSAAFASVALSSPLVVGAPAAMAGGLISPLAAPNHMSSSNTVISSANSVGGRSTTSAPAKISSMPSTLATSKDTTTASSSVSAANPTSSTPSTSGNNTTSNNNNTNDPTYMKRHKISLLLDQCEAVRFPFKKKLMLNNLSLTNSDIPVKDLYNTSLGNSLHKFSLAGNRLSSIPPKLVTCLPVLKTLDLSQCELHQLPERWNLPQLKRLNLSHNRLTDFPEETMLEGLLELQELNMYGNKVSVIIVPHNPKVLAKLESLNLGYNDLAYIPEELDRLKSLRVLKVMNNFLEKIPMRVCDMELKTIDVSSNPVIQPPIETCERGICSMKRYYQCLRMEEQSKQKAVEALQSKAASRKGSGKMFMGKKKVAVMDKVMSFTMGKRTSSLPQQTQQKRKTSDESNASSNARDDRTVVTTASGYSAGGTAQRSSSLTSAPSGASVMSRSSSVDMDSYSKRKSTPALSDSHKRSVTVGGSGASKQSDSAPFSLSDTDGKPYAAPSPLSPSAATSKSSFAIASASEASSPLTEARKAAAADAAFSSGASVSTSIAGDAETVVSSDTREYHDEITVNDTLKVIFVGMAMAGKTSMIKRLIEGEKAIIPKRDERTVGVDIYEWDPKNDHRFEHIDSRIDFQDKELEEQCGDVNVKFSVWDFAGQHVYHATHELFFSPRALYVLVWDMGATNPATKQRKSAEYETTQGAFRLSYDSDDDSDDDDDFTSEEEARRADRALERDIDDKVQFWVDCIQSSAPGAAILPVASFDDLFSDNNNQEAKRRCNILKQRLLKHEARRIQGIKDRLKEYCDSNRANDEAAMRLRKLLCSYTRPKLIFGNTDEDSVVRVSGTRYTGFATLTGRIIDIATGRDKGQWRYPIFRGHVGARIPRMRLEVREAVRRMRDRFKVVEWGYFINQLRERGLSSVEDISDALHFLTNIGELSYFGGVLPDRERLMNSLESNSFLNRDSAKLRASDDLSAASEDEDDEEDDDEENGYFSIDNTSLTMPSTDDGSLTTFGDHAGGLSQFVFLNPRWLVAAVACILRHDLDREIQETRRLLHEGNSKQVSRGDSFYEVNLNCPVITADDACMLWQAKKFTKKAAERAQQYSNHLTLKPFEFLQLLLIKFGVFVPIDLGIEKAFLGGIEYAKKLSDVDDTPDEITVGQESSSLESTFFFLPSLLGPGEPVEAWTYKSTDSWKATLCHSVLFPDGVPPGLMERITATVLSNIYSIAHRKETPIIRSIMDGKMYPSHEGQLTVKEVLCWRTAFLVKLGMLVGSNEDSRESIVEVFCGLVDKDSHLCVGSEYMATGQRRLITSGKGQEGDGGRKIWTGGYRLVISAVQKVMAEYGGLEYEKQAFCPDCLAKKAVGEASSWGFSVVRAAAKNGEGTMICRHGHRIDTRLVAGPTVNLQHQNKESLVGNPSQPIVPITDILRGVVVVGLWDGNTKKVVRVGSGFIADKKRGLIVTASHTLMNIWGDPNSPFGDNYYGLRQGKVVIGIIPRNKGEETGTEAYFRYFAKIVTKDPDIERGVCHLDACVLRITTRMENDVGGSGEGCGDQIERLLLNNPHAMAQEKLQRLKITDKCELDEQVRIIGFNQGGEGLLGPGVSLNRRVDFARGYVCKKFGGGEVPNDVGELRNRFKPREEIVVICPTIGGHSGGPCVNQQGEVIGILSRADPAESQRCYLVPTYEWAPLLRQAKQIL